MPTTANYYAQRLAVNGTPTTINGITGLQAVWPRAQAGRVQGLTAETLENAPVYSVILPAAALQAPYKIANGSTLIWVSTGWTGVVRSLDAVDVGGTIVAVIAYTELTSG